MNKHVEVLREMRAGYAAGPCVIQHDKVKALDVAIAALSAEPVGDAVSIADSLRQVAISYPKDSGLFKTFSDFSDRVRSLAQPQRQTIVGWIHEDELPNGYPYEAMFPHSKVDGVRMFPVFAPSDEQPQREVPDDLIPGDGHRWGDFSRNELCDLIEQLQDAAEQPASQGPAPDGWKFEDRNDGTVLVTAKSGAATIIAPDGWQRSIASHVLWELVAEIRNYGQQPASQGQERQPDGYMYRYLDGIRDTGGNQWNGERPIEEIPYYFGTQPASAAVGSVLSVGTLNLLNRAMIRFGIATPESVEVLGIKIEDYLLSLCREIDRHWDLLAAAPGVSE